MICNPQLLSNVQTVPIPLNIIYPGLGTIWLDQHGIANIVSLYQLKEQHHIVYDSGTNNEFVLTDADGNVMRFSELGDRLYYYDTNDCIGIALISTVKHNKSSYTDTDYHRALAARELQIKIGRPSTKDFKNIIVANLLPNCPVTRQDINVAEDIFGPDIGSLKGKTTHRGPHKVRQPCADPWPWQSKKGIVMSPYVLMLCTLMEPPCLLLSVIISSLELLKVSDPQAQRT